MFRWDFLLDVRPIKLTALSECNRFLQDVFSTINLLCVKERQGPKIFDTKRHEIQRQNWFLSYEF